MNSKKESESLCLWLCLMGIQICWIFWQKEIWCLLESLQELHEKLGWRIREKRFSWEPDDSIKGRVCNLNSECQILLSQLDSSLAKKSFLVLKHPNSFLDLILWWMKPSRASSVFTYYTGWVWQGKNGTSKGASTIVWSLSSVRKKVKGGSESCTYSNQ